MIKRIQYPDWFQDFWSEALKMRTRTLGSKPKALEVARRLKMCADDVGMVLEAFQRHTDKIRAVQATGQFIENHADMERWLKQRRWENEEDERCDTINRIQSTALPKSDQRKREASERFRSRFMGDSVEQTTGREGGMGGVGQHYLTLLDEPN